MSVIVREKVKGSGVWWLFINHRGKRKSKKIGKNKKHAKEVAEKVEARLVLGQFDIGEDEAPPTFGEYAEIWIDTIVPVTCKPITHEGYLGILKHHLLPVFKDTPVQDINRMQIKKFIYKKVKAGYSTGQVRKIKNVMSCVFNTALEADVLAVNPVKTLGRLRLKETKEKIDFLTKEELSLLLNAFTQHFPQHYPFMLCLARTGMRLGEGIGLQWGDIDFNGRFITINRTLTNGRVGTPKSGKSRKIDMSLLLSNTLWKLKRERMKEMGDNMPEWVFLNSVNDHLRESNWRKHVFNRALDKAELRRIRIHDIRHTLASLLIQDGVSLVYIKELLGHHSIKITVDTYGHLVPGGNKAAVDALDEPENTHFSAPYTHPVETVSS